MKLEILCKKCTDMVRETVSKSKDSPSEGSKFVQGKSKDDFRCNGCDVLIKKGDWVCAVSLWTIYSPTPCYEWEREVIEEEA